jgi:two-component system cell cycle response regulator DivK
MSIQDQEKTILIVEDNELNMKLAVDLLELAGFRTLKAFDGETALKILKTERPDLILLDIMMPGIGGPDVDAKLRENESTAQIPIIYLSSLVSKEDEQEQGKNVVLAKPYDNNHLLAKINAMIFNGRVK